MQLKEAKPPLDYDMNDMCEFHSRAPEHSIENCKSFKYKVQNLINSKAIAFTPNVLDVLNTPMPPHEGTFAMP